MTELIWQGKYDENGKRTAPLRVSLPFQTVETINESTIERQRMLDLFSAGRDSDWRNRLIWGDKKYVLPSLLDEFAGKVNLIYIDPPFNVGADFSFNATIADHPDTEHEDETTSFIKQPSLIEQKAYRDTWGKGLDSYLQWFYETTAFSWELLAENGSIYVHLDYHIGHYAKAVLDEVFGQENFMNQVIWHRTSAHSDSNTYGNAHDIIFFYVKSNSNFLWNKQYQNYDQKYVESHYRYVDEKGRRYRTDNLTAMGLHGGGYTYEWNGVTKIWRAPIETMKQLEADGRIRYTRNGVAEYIRYLDEMPGTLLQDT